MNGPVDSPFAALDGKEPGTMPVNVLLVDDQPGRLLTYRAILEPLGERLLEATSGQDALRVLMKEDCAVILLDVNMPGMDGFETASLIHQHPRYERTPIIFVSAVNLSDMDRLRGYKLGAVDYVMVPIIPEILRSKVMVLAELQRKRRALEEANRKLADANVALQVEKMRELDVLNASLRNANAQLAASNEALRHEVGERGKVEARLREQDRNKDEFLAVLAHELRNPLAALSNAVHAQRMAHGDTDPLAQAMRRQVGVLVRLIDDLMDVARIAQDKLVLQRQPTTLADVLEAARETVAPLLDAGGHVLQVHQPTAPVALSADPARLVQVFGNLLSNAAKYSDPGKPIVVEVRCDGDDVEVAVIDQGIGLSAADAAGVFERFRQADSAVARAQGGLGIGLSLVKRLVEMHGGRVCASSAGPGQGSRFTVHLPLAPADGARPPDPTEAPAAASPLRPMRVLIVDDNRDSADTLAVLLDLLGHRVERSYDPLEVERIVAERPPELVLLDIGMPGLDGCELARRLRAGPGGDALRLVAVTGWGQPEDRRRTAAAGFDAHLVKPVDADALLRLVADWTAADAT
jgi:signal transduction histidine kinase